MGCTGQGSPTAKIQDLVLKDTTPAAPPEPQKLPIGLTLAVGEAASTYSYDVTITSAETVTSYTTDSGTVSAGAGKKFILIEAKIDQKADIAVSVGRSNFFATDSEMITKYSSSYAGKDGLVGSTQLAPGESTTGKAAFEVPENIQSPMVVYEFGPDITVTNMVGWNIP